MDPNLQKVIKYSGPEIKLINLENHSSYSGDRLSLLYSVCRCLSVEIEFELLFVATNFVIVCRLDVAKSGNKSHFLKDHSSHIYK